MAGPSAIRCVLLRAFALVNPGADDGIRTRDPHLGKVVLYQLSHVRVLIHPRSPFRDLQPLRRHRRRGDQSIPVEPNPPSPRPLSGRSSAHLGDTDGIATITSWAIRSPVRISTASSRSRFTTEQITSPR